VFEDFSYSLSETVWKIGMAPESGFRKRPTGIESASIGSFSTPKNRGRGTLDHFPNSFSTHSAE
jgi:hypothetical protein